MTAILIAAGTAGFALGGITAFAAACMWLDREIWLRRIRPVLPPCRGDESRLEALVVAGPFFTGCEHAEILPVEEYQEWHGTAKGGG